jgi:hypothetical protein
MNTTRLLLQQYYCCVHFSLIRSFSFDFFFVFFSSSQRISMELLIANAQNTEADLLQLKSSLLRNGAQRVDLEMVDRLHAISLASSKYQRIHLTPLFHASHSIATLAHCLKALIPSTGELILEEIILDGQPMADGCRSTDAVVRDLALAGFKPADIQQTASRCLTDNEKTLVNVQLAPDVLGRLRMVTFSAKKPAYEVGAAMPLKLGRKAKTTTGTAAPSSMNGVTSMDEKQRILRLALDDQDESTANVELIDADDLLDETDRQRPDPSSLESEFLF